MPPKPEHDSDVLTVREAAGFLRLHERSVYVLLNKGEIPGRRVGRAWRLSKRALEKWLAEGTGGPKAPK